MNLIWQAAVGEGYKEQPLVRIGIQRAREWAERIDAEHYLFEGPNRYRGNTSVKLHAMDEEFDKYDLMLVLDVDMYPTDRAPNIFDTVEPGDLLTGVTNGGEANKFIHNPSGGSVIYTREMRQKVREVWSKYDSYLNGSHCQDEHFIGNLCKSEGITITPRKDQRWDCFPGKPRCPIDEAYLIHYVGKCRAEHYREEDWV